jgi:predicted RecA/RadA family phage recombinase
MSASAILTAIPREEIKTVPSGGYVNNQFVQAPSGRAGYVDRAYNTAAGDSVVIRTEGVVQLPCASGTVASTSQQMWWDSANDLLVPYAPAAGWYAGLLVVAKTDGQTSAQVALNELPAPGAVLTKTADYTVLASQSGATLTNTGAAGTITFALPAALPGMRFNARVSVAQQLRLDPNGTETISLPSTGVPGAAGKYLVADAIGETVALVCLVAGTWSVMGYTGTWTAEA